MIEENSYVLPEILATLRPTGEFRYPQKGEYYMCPMCREVEKCIFPNMCGVGEIYK